MSNEKRKASPSKTPRGLIALQVVALAMTASGCALVATNSDVAKQQFVPTPWSKPDKAAGSQRDPLSEDRPAEERGTSFYQTPKMPEPARSSVGNPPPAPTRSDAKEEPIAAVALESMPLPQFVNAVYGVVLKRNVSMDPAVLQRTDLVSLRTGKAQTPSQLAAAAQAVLRSYGLAVNEFQGLVRVVPETNQSGYLPEIRRGRAQPEIPASLRPVFYYVELEHTMTAGVTTWLRNLFPNRLTVTEDAPRNAVMLSGQSDTVSAAMEAIQLLDQPMLRGRVSARLTPVFWSADELAKRLTDVLAAEGYAVAQQPGATTPILVLPVAPINSIIVFATNQTILNHTLRWARDLDQTPQGTSGGYINYYVRNTDASDLAKTLQEVMGGSSAVAATGGAGAASGVTVNKKVVVNSAANGLIIKATPSEYQQLYGLLQELDRPARSVLISATVAEVRLSDNEQFGFNWLLNEFTKHGVRVSGGVGLPAQPSTGTFRLNFANLAGNPQALLTALASSNRIRILSNPSLVALNGQAATIQVGQEVPILTSQISNANTGTTTGQGVLQTIQYRSTGMILKIKPVIHSGGRVDIEVSQEVSAAQVNETGVNSSPVISTRRIETKMSLTDGNTTLLGGLISENRSSGDAGLPYLKDIPFAGALFRTNANATVDRTELVVLLTPHVISDDFDAQAITSAFRSQFSWAMPALEKPARPAAPEASNEGGVTPGKTDVNAPAPAADEAKAAVSAKSPEPAPAKPAPGEKIGDKGAAAPRSKTYALPEKDGVDSVAPRSVAPIQQERREATVSAPTVTPPAAEIKDNSAARTQRPNPPGGKTVTDDSLRQELLETLKRGQ